MERNTQQELRNKREVQLRESNQIPIRYSCLSSLCSVPVTTFQSFIGSNADGVRMSILPPVQTIHSHNTMRVVIQNFLNEETSLRALEVISFFFFYFFIIKVFIDISCIPGRTQ